jgi:PD-(D/E)XK endonuclease
VNSTNHKGAVAEAAIAFAATRLGVEVYRPVHEGGRFDLILAPDDRLIRVQCKAASAAGAIVSVHFYSCRRTGAGQVKRFYTAAEIDAIGAYAATIDRCFLIPIEYVDGRWHFRVRLLPTRNNQARGIHWADDFDFEARLRTTPGAIAQLGERRAGSAKVTGSNPVGSIPTAAEAIV